MNRFSLCFGVLLAWTLSAQGNTSAAEPNSGKEMYLRYCSSCHGRKATGDGPVSRDLKIKVPDLTILGRENHGVYPLDEVMATIDGRRSVRAHGGREMPVWGENFRAEAEGKKYVELTTLLKAKIIAEYLATLQKK